MTKIYPLTPRSSPNYLEEGSDRQCHSPSWQSRFTWSIFVYSISFSSNPLFFFCLAELMRCKGSGCSSLIPSMFIGADDGLMLQTYPSERCLFHFQSHSTDAPSVYIGCGLVETFAFFFFHAQASSCSWPRTCHLTWTSTCYHSPLWSAYVSSSCWFSWYVESSFLLLSLGRDRTGKQPLTN